MKLSKELPIFSLLPDRIHIWLFRLEDPDRAYPVWERSLSVVERERSKQYKFESDRLRFIARRGLLRQLLGRYSGIPPAGISYQIDPYGKPSLPSSPFSFNLSSSQDRIAFAFSLGKDIGVDIECVRPLPDLIRVAERWFSQHELTGLLDLPMDLQLEAFYHVWTQKEAFMKARGQGLSYPLHDFSVSVDPGQPGRLLSIKEDLEQAAHWKMATTAETGWRAAVCVRAEAEPEFLWHEPGLAEFMASTR